MQIIEATLLTIGLPGAELAKATALAKNEVRKRKRDGRGVLRRYNLR